MMKSRQPVSLELRSLVHRFAVLQIAVLCLSVSALPVHAQWQWGNPTFWLGKEIVKTASRPGYVITHQGEQLVGGISLRKVNNKVVEVSLKSGRAKNKYLLEDLQGFGLLMNLSRDKSASTTNNPLEFHAGQIVLNNGEIVSGLVGLKPKFNSRSGFQGAAVYQVNTEKISDFKAEDLRRVEQIINGESRTWSPTGASSQSNTPNLRRAGTKTWQWGLPVVVLNKQTLHSKWQNGYVTLASGEQQKGELRLTLTNGQLSRLQMRKITGVKGKKKYDVNQVVDYGLLLDLAPTKKSRLAANSNRLFHSGWVVVGGQRIHGRLALKEEDHVPNSIDSIAFLGKDSDFIQRYSAQNVDAVVQVIDGVEYALSADEDSFVTITQAQADSFFDIDHSSQDAAWDWRFGSGMVNGVQQWSSKWQPGFVTLVDGNTLQGDISVRAYPAGSGQGIPAGAGRLISRVTIKNVVGEIRERSFAVGQLQTFGLLQTIASVSRNGSRQNRRAEKNFHPGWVRTQSGERIDGFLALDDSSGLMFAENQDAFIKSLNPKKVTLATQLLDGRELEWQGYRGGFILTPTLDELRQVRSKDQELQLHRGSVELKDGSRLSGSISQVKLGWVGMGVNFVDSDGAVTRYADQLASFTQVIEDVEHVFVNYRDVYTEVVHDGDRWRLFRNPFPTSVDARRKYFSQVLEQGLRAGLSQQQRKYAQSKAQQQFEKSTARGADLFTASARAIDAGNGVMSAGRVAGANESITPNYDLQQRFLRPEYRAFNKSTAEEFFVHKDNIAAQFETVIAECGRFERLSRKQKGSLLKFESVPSLMEVLDDC